jgi:hypothetical protein
MNKSVEADGAVVPLHRLAWLDQLAYELFRSTGRNQLMQCLWVYERDVDYERLEDICDRLSRNSFNRLIEPSTLPWGRPRWVKPVGRPVVLEKSPAMLGRSHLMHWATEQAHKPIDPVAGPAWRLAIQRFDDGSTALSFVGSHLVLDGMGALRAIEATICGTARPNLYLAQSARGWITGLFSDTVQVLADAPSSVVGLAKLVVAIAQSRQFAIGKFWAKADVAPLTEKEKVIRLPSVAITVDADAWDACALRLGGHSNSLLAGFTATLAAHLGRIRSSDGSASLLVPVDRRRGPGDERAIAMKLLRINVDPNGVTTSLKAINHLFMATLRNARHQPDNLLKILPAVAWLSGKTIAALANNMFSYESDLPVSCSNIGALSTELARIDGAPCDRMLTRAIDVDVTIQDLNRSNGHLVVVASRYGQLVTLCIEGCQAHPTRTTPDELRQITQRTLAEFRLEALIEN